MPLRRHLDGHGVVIHVSRIAFLATTGNVSAVLCILSQSACEIVRICQALLVSRSTYQPVCGQTDLRMT